MDKFDITRFTDAALKQAGKVYMTGEDMKAMGKKRKQEEEQFKFLKKQGEANVMSEALNDAMAFHKLQHPEKYKTENVQRIIYGPEGEGTGKKEVDVTTRYEGSVGKGGGKGEATTGQWLTSQRANVDDRANIINKIRGKLNLDPNIQIFIDAAGELDAVTRYEDIAEIYNKALAKIEEASKEKESIWVEHAKRDLEEYIKLTDWRLYYEMKIRGTSPPVKGSSTTTEIPITGAGAGAPDEVLEMDEIIKGIK